MLIFLAILVVGLVLVYINLSTLAKGLPGKIIALAVLLAIFASMFFRETLVGAIVISFFAVWLCQSLLLYIPWTLYRIGYYFTQPHHRSRHKVRRVSRWLLGITVGFTGLIFALGVPHNDDYKMNLKTITLPSQYTESFTAVFFSDVHIDPLFSRQKLERLVADVDSIAPDYLLFGGDLMDVPTTTLSAWGYDTLFKKMTSSAKIAAVAINGNHEGMQERGNSDPDSWMRDVGFVVLDDSTECIGLACFTGRTDFQVARRRGTLRKPLTELIPAMPAETKDSLEVDSLKTASAKVAVEDSSVAPDSAKADSIVMVDDPRPWILLDHQPKGIEKSHSGRLPDYAFSGHTHDGQFFPGTIVINWVWKIASGVGALSGVYWIVSSGFDCWGPPVRFGSDSEILVIRFKAHEP